MVMMEPGLNGWFSWPAVGKLRGWVVSIGCLFGEVDVDVDVDVRLKRGGGGGEGRECTVEFWLSCCF